MGAITNEMCWMGIGGSENTEKILHLNINGTWQPYHRSSLAVADYSVPKGSRGYATMQRLLKAGWQLVPAPQAPVSIGYIEERSQPVPTSELTPEVQAYLDKARASKGVIEWQTIGQEDFLKQVEE